jgi:dTDP-4-amino-4,6-dideoxygalactose transaminase
VTDQIPITKPVFGPEELRAVQRPLEDGWVVQGPQVAEFERRFGAYVAAEHNVATSSCTTALHLAVAALGVGPGDEVIVPAFTWISTANVVEYMGATPVFCDVDLDTFNVSPASVEAALTERTVGIIAVHLFGLAADLDRLQSIASRHGLWIVEDAACAFGAFYDGRHVGTFGAAGAFSFHPRKSITTGEGGMLTTNDAALASLSRSLRDHGATRSDRERHGQAGSFLLSEYPYLGFNYRMTDLQGALGCAQLDRADWILARRREVAAAYDEALGPLEWLRAPVVPERCVHGYQAYVTLFAPEEPTPANLDELADARLALMDRLEARGIATRQGTHAPVIQTFYAEKYGLRPEDFFHAVAADRLSIALPLFPALEPHEQERVVAELATGRG